MSKNRENLIFFGTVHKCVCIRELTHFLLLKFSNTCQVYIK